ncbi:hypothetical protein [Luteibacter yeojuensis]
MHVFFHRYRRRCALWVFAWLAWAMVIVGPAWSTDVHAAPGPGVHRTHVQHASAHMASASADEGGCNDHDGNCCHGPGQACHCTPACASVLPVSVFALGDTTVATITIFAAGIRAAPQAGYGPPLRPPAA